MKKGSHSGTQKQSRLWYKENTEQNTKITEYRNIDKILLSTQWNTALFHFVLCYYYIIWIYWEHKVYRYQQIDY